MSMLIESDFRNPDHAQLSQLASEDPVAFEAVRLKLINDILDRAPERLKHRLRGLQFRIDSVRQCSRNPLGATVKIYEMMWSSFSVLNRELNEFHEPIKPPQKKSGRVFEFRPRQSATSI